MGKCKSCHLGHHEPVQVGTQLCTDCFRDLPVEDFTIQRTIKGGRKHQCKACVAARARDRNKHKPAYRNPRSGTASADRPRIQHDCEVCTKTFFSVRANHRRCSFCTIFVRRLHSRLTGSRAGGRRRRVPVSLAVEMARRMLQAKACTYCGRTFNSGIRKSMDHIVPVAGGGKTEGRNLAIVCRICNFTKRDLLLTEWVDHCARVVAWMSTAPG